MSAVVELMPQPTAIASAMSLDFLRILVEKDAPLDKIERFMDLRERMAREDERRAFNQAMANFRSTPVAVTRSSVVKQGPLTNTPYARLSDFVNAAGPALTTCGLSASWRITRDEKDWIEVACVIRHKDGHQEETKMGGPPDTGGAKNMIQARASTVSYLEKYTFKMALGLAEQDDDDDGNGGPDNGQPRHEEQRRSDWGNKPEAEPAPTKQAFSTEGFDKKLKGEWKDFVAKGSLTPAEIIGRVGKKYELTAAQRKQIHALANPSENIDA